MESIRGGGKRKGAGTAGGYICVHAGCDQPGKLRCVRCKEVFYCTQEHQRLHWNGSHKRHCIPVPTSATAGGAATKMDFRSKTRPFSKFSPLPPILPAAAGAGAPVAPTLPTAPCPPRTDVADHRTAADPCTPVAAMSAAQPAKPPEGVRCVPQPEAGGGGALDGGQGLVPGRPRSPHEPIKPGSSQCLWCRQWWIR